MKGIGLNVAELGTTVVKCNSYEIRNISKASASYLNTDKSDNSEVRISQSKQADKIFFSIVRE